MNKSEEKKLVLLQALLLGFVVYNIMIYQFTMHAIRKEPFPCNGTFDGIYCWDDFSSMEKFRLPKMKGVIKSGESKTQTIEKGIIFKNN